MCLAQSTNRRLSVPWRTSELASQAEELAADSIPVMLVGNKCDETESREVKTNLGKAQAEIWKTNFMETSAKNDHNVTELFQVWLPDSYSLVKYDF